MIGSFGQYPLILQYLGMYHANCILNANLEVDGLSAADLHENLSNLLIKWIVSRVTARNSYV